MKTHYISDFKWGMVVICMMLIVSCSEDPEIEYFVDPSLQEYFDRFVMEGAERNITVDLVAEHISGYLKIITTEDVVGQCVHQEDKPDQVIVDRNYWMHATDLQREFVVFHELGHCYLNRSTWKMPIRRGIASASWPAAREVV